MAKAAWHRQLLHTVYDQTCFSAVAEALQSLAQDLAHGNSAAKERAVAMLSSLTLYVDHHDAILATPGVLQALLASVADERLVPQASNSDQTHPCYLAGCADSARLVT